MSRETKPRVTTKCVANQYAADSERIVEVHDDVLDIGCLVSFRRRNGKLVICPYRADKNVVVNISGHTQDFQV